MAGRRLGALAAGGTALVCAVVVAVTAGGDRPVPVGAPPAGAVDVIQAFLLLLAFGEVGVVALLVWALSGAGRPRSGPDSGGRRLYAVAGAVQAALVVIIVWLRLALYHPGTGGASSAGGGLAALGRLVPAGGPGGAAGHGGPASFWLAGALAVVVVTAIAAWARQHRPGLPAPVAPEAAAAGLVAAETALEAEADPRRAVIRAYGAMASAFSAAGLERRAWETADEYMTRVFRALGAEPAAVRVLTGLYHRARFAPHPVGENLRTDALAALEGARQALAAAAPAGRL